MTIREALSEASRVLAENRIPPARLNAEVLLSHCLDVEKTYLYTHDREEIPEDQLDEFIRRVRRRARGEPLQYITGIQEFYGRRFRVNESVLIPRPETEFVVEAVRELNQWPTPSIADIGTGSGSIAVTLALELPGSRVLATDVFFDAVRTARNNAEGLGAAVGFAVMDRTLAVGGKFHFLVSNPPYIASGEHPHLQREVRQHEPYNALVPGTLDSPEDFYRALIREAESLVVPDGYAVLEIGYTMETSTRALFGEQWTLLPTRHDLQGFPRVIVARRN